MSRSSPARRSQFTSPDRPKTLFLSDERNSELNHRDALAAAQVEHERVRQAALRVFELHELEEKHKRIVEEERKETKRLEAEAAIVAEEKRLRELRAKTIPRPPPEPEPAPAPPSPVKPTPVAKTNGTTPVKDTKQEAQSTTPPSEVKKPTITLAPPTTSTLPNKPAPNNPVVIPPQINNILRPNDAPTKPLSNGLGQTPAPKPQPVKAPGPDRYVQIHQELKLLRKNMQAASKVPGSPLKGKMGAYRREIRQSLGTLTGGRGANNQTIATINAALKAALDGSVPSPPIDVSLYVADRREPSEGAVNNGDTLPALFIYLINIVAKGIISQFINEASANPKAAEPVGVFTAQIFSTKEYQWRGKPLIDILIAKFRVVCPVLFGHRGNEKTERGRLALGWKKDGPSWITEQSHNNRMTGLGAGYASLTLRDFSKTSKTNPYPPTNYWKAMAGIVNSPASEISNTQYVVLRSMLQGHEQRFITFYGNAAIAALRLALIEFPKKAPASASAAGSLRALADVLESEEGLVLG